MDTAALLPIYNTIILCISAQPAAFCLAQLALLGAHGQAASDVCLTEISFLRGRVP